MVMLQVWKLGFAGENGEGAYTMTNVASGGLVEWPCGLEGDGYDGVAVELDNGDQAGAVGDVNDEVGGDVGCGDVAHAIIVQKSGWKVRECCLAKLTLGELHQERSELRGQLVWP